MRVSLNAPGGAAEWSPGSPYELAAYVFTQSWEVWTHEGTGEIELRNFENICVEGATVSFTLDSGDGNFSTAVLATDGDGNTSTWLTLGGGNAVVRVEASPDGIALASTTMDVSCAVGLEEDPGEQPVDEPLDEPLDEPVDEPVDQPVDQPADPPAGEEWSYSHTETVISPSLQFTDGDITLAASTSSGITASVIAHTWDVWTSNYGNVEVLNESQSPAEGAQISWSIESGDGSFVASSDTTDAAGNANGTFQMGGYSSVLRIDVTYAGSYTAFATLDAILSTTNNGSAGEGYETPGSGGDGNTSEESGSGDDGTASEEAVSGDDGTGIQEEWTYSHTESSVGTTFSISDGTDPSDASLLVPGQDYIVTTTVNYESWEVWTSNYGNTQWVNYSASPASYVPVLMGVYSAGSWQQVSSNFAHTDYNGQVQTTFTMTSNPAEFVSKSNFYGTVVLGTQYLHPGEVDNGEVDNGGGDNGSGDNGSGDNGSGDNGSGDNGSGDNGSGDNGGGGDETPDTFAFSDYGQSLALDLSWNGDTSSVEASATITSWENWVDETGATESRNINYSSAFTPDVQITSEPDVSDSNYTIYHGTASFDGLTATGTLRVYNENSGGSGGGDSDTTGGNNDGGSGNDENGETCELE